MTGKKIHRPEPDLTKALQRIKKHSKKVKERNIAPPVDDEEPTGRLSGGPEHLDLSGKD